MYLMGIDFNINSLPVAAIGIGIGIDYGYYVLSRIVEEYEVTRDFDEANRRAIATTGKAIMFTGATHRRQHRLLALPSRSSSRRRWRFC